MFPLPVRPQQNRSRALRLQPRTARSLCLAHADYQIQSKRSPLRLCLRSMISLVKRVLICQNKTFSSSGFCSFSRPRRGKLWRLRPSSFFLSQYSIWHMYYFLLVILFLCQLSRGQWEEENDLTKILRSTSYNRNAYPTQDSGKRFLNNSEGLKCIV